MESEICAEVVRILQQYDRQDAYVVEELGSSVPLNIVGIEVSPTELHIDPELVARCSIQNIFALFKEGQCMSLRN